LLSRRIPLVAAIAVVTACGSKDSPGGPTPPPPPPTVAAVNVSAPGPSVTVGRTIQFTAAAVNTAGQPISGKTFTWISSDQSVASVDANGLVTGVTMGAVSIMASTDGKSGNAPLTVVLPAVSSVAVTPTFSAIAVGNTATLVATVRDTDGGTSTTRLVEWTTSDTTIAVVSSRGEVSARKPGVVGVTATAEGRNARVDVVVVSASAPVITSISPDTLISGTTAAIRGTNFGPDPRANTVRVGGTTVTITAASETTLAVTLPAVGCAPTSAIDVVVETVSGNGAKTLAVRAATPRSLAVGQAIVLSGADARCNALPPDGGRYILSVFNHGTTIGASGSFDLRGSAAAAGSAISTTVLAAPRSATGPLRQTPAPDHAALLEANRRAIERAGPALPQLRSARGANAVRAQRAAALDLVTVGTMNSIRVPNVSGGSFSGDFCNNHTSVRARTVYVGTRTIILEDSTSAAARRMDAQLTALGQEFDASMFDIIERNFGSPLVLDGQLDANGRLVMLFSPRVNASGFSGFVVTCDFYPTTTYASSNVGEIFYAAVPTATQSADLWLRTMRSTVIHEVKHIASFADRVSRTVRLDESWLEEGTARHAEELWARTVFGYGGTDNTTYARSLFCEARSDIDPCTGKPQIMQKHYAALYDYLSSSATLSPLGRPAGTTDFTFYASAWSLIRWAIDHSGESDQTFLHAIGHEPTLTGVANLEARAHRSFAEMLGYWSLSWATDDRVGFTASIPELQVPSWNTTDVFLGLNTDFPGRFVRPSAVLPASLTFGAFSARAATILGGTATLFELSGTQASTQVIELLPSGSTPLGLAIARVQ
jgi:hypothetical protein